MNTLRLPGTDIETTELGFGCSALLGPKHARETQALLEAAYDAGIRHFDVARAYGYGDAEGVLGRFLKGRRQEVTLTTKFGRQPMNALAGRRGLVDLARRLMRRFSFVREFVRRQHEKVMTQHAFDVEEARSSLETSLKELQTDYVDLFLLHEPRPEDCRPDELLEFLHQIKKSGKVRAFGIGTDVESTASILKTVPEVAEVIQCRNSVVERNLEQLDGAGGERAVSTHGAFGGLERLHQYLSERPEAAQEWSRQVQADCGDKQELAALMLGYAVQDNRRGPVVLSSTKPEHVTRNAAVVVEEPFSSEQIARFSELVAQKEILP